MRTLLHSLTPCTYIRILYNNSEVQQKLPPSSSARRNTVVLVLSFSSHLHDFCIFLYMTRSEILGGTSFFTSENPQARDFESSCRINKKSRYRSGVDSWMQKPNLAQGSGCEFSRGCSIISDILAALSAAMIFNSSSYCCKHPIVR